MGRDDLKGRGEMKSGGEAGIISKFKLEGLSALQLPNILEGPKIDNLGTLFRTQ